MDFNLDNVPEAIANNLNLWQEIWKTQCSKLKNFEPGEYSRHLLLVLPDLDEEVHFNINSFRKNTCGKNFFSSVIGEYILKKDFKKQWVKKISVDLAFIHESLSSNNQTGGKFELSDIKRLIYRVENYLRSTESFNCVVELLINELSNPNCDSDKIMFLTDTIILLFWRNVVFLLRSRI